MDVFSKMRRFRGLEINIQAKHVGGAVTDSECLGIHTYIIAGPYRSGIVHLEAEGEMIHSETAHYRAGEIISEHKVAYLYEVGMMHRCI